MARLGKWPRSLAIVGSLIVVVTAPAYVEQRLTIPLFGRLAYPLFAMSALVAAGEAFVRQTTFCERQIIHRTWFGRLRRYSYGDIQEVVVRVEYLDIDFGDKHHRLRIRFAEADLKAVVRLLQIRVAESPLGRVLEPEPGTEDHWPLRLRAM